MLPRLFHGRYFVVFENISFAQPPNPTGDDGDMLYMLTQPSTSRAHFCWKPGHFINASTAPRCTVHARAASDDFI